MASKFGNRKTVIDGRTFDSAKEARRWSELCLLERAGQIQGLVCQPRFDIAVNGQHICTYVGDFTYVEKGRGVIVEDVKSPVTRKLPVYRLKAKLVKAIYGFGITEL